MAHTFDETITSRERLREVIGGQPSQSSADKAIDRIDEACARFIAAAPFVLIATRGEDGGMDISPKGDPAGFVRVLDERTLAIPDRPGNRRLDTFENVLDNPQVGLIFLVPGVTHTLRVSGTARIVSDPALAETMRVKRHAPSLILVVDVQEAFMHCAKCMMRSGLWDPDTWNRQPDVPTLGEAIIAHAKLTDSLREVEDRISDSYRTKMY